MIYHNESFLRFIEYSSMNNTRDKELLKKFGLQLKRLRIERTLSLRDLAAITEVDYAHINKIENGLINPTYTMLHILADALEVSIAELVTIPGTRGGKK